MTSDARDGAFQTSDGATIAFTVHPAPHADAPRLVLIHSLALDRSVWDGVVGIIAGETELLTYDCRGHGRSDRRATTFTAELFARDLGQLLHHVGWQRAAIGGCSMGGCVAMAFAGIYPKGRPAWRSSTRPRGTVRRRRNSFARVPKRRAQPA